MHMKINNQLPTKSSPTPAKTTEAQTSGAAAKPAGNLALTAGEIVKGTVLEITSDGKALLDIGGRTVTAQTLVPLKANMELLLEVKEGGTTPWLAPAGKKGVAQEIIRMLFSEGANIAKAATLLTETGAKPAAAPLPPAILEALNNLQQEIGDKATGAKAEPHKLAQLLAHLSPTGKNATAIKSLGRQLAETVEQLAAKADNDHPAISKLKTMAKLLDAHQQLNAQQPAQQAANQPEFLLFPCFFAGDNGWGEWLFQMESGGKGDEKQTTTSIDFFLQMSRLGDVHLKVFMQGEGLRGEFFVEEESVRSHLKDALPQLTAILEGHGYKPISLTVRQSTENLFHSFKKELEEKASLRPFALVDVTA